MSDLHDSQPPTEAWTAFQVTLNLFMLRREVKDLRIQLATAQANDERFLVIEQHFTAQQKTLAAMKKYVAAAVLGAMGALGSVVVNRMATRVAPAPPPLVSSGASTALDRVPERDAGRP